MLQYKALMSPTYLDQNHFREFLKMELHNKKEHYRKIFKAKLEKTKQASNVYALDSKIESRLKLHLNTLLKLHKTQTQKPFNLLLYYPLPIEFNIQKLMRFYQTKTKVQIFLPRISKDSFNATPYRLPLQKQNFNVYAPQNSLKNTKIFHCAVVPVIGVDKTLRRIGFGKGMFDRFFATHQVQNVIFVSRFFNIAQEIITETHDVRGDFYLTPFKTLQLRHSSLRIQ